MSGVAGESENGIRTLKTRGLAKMRHDPFIWAIQVIEEGSNMLLQTHSVVTSMYGSKYHKSLYDVLVVV